jgi:hypothetical protein
MATFKKVVKTEIAYLQYCHDGKAALFSGFPREEGDPWFDDLEIKLKSIIKDIESSGINPTPSLVKSRYLVKKQGDDLNSLRQLEKSLQVELTSVRGEIRRLRIKNYLIKYRKLYLSSKGYARKVIEKRLGIKLDVSEEELNLLLDNKQLQLKILRLIKNGEQPNRKPHRPVQKTI